MSKKDDHKPIVFKGASDMPPMAASQGSMRTNKTASWRSIRPIIDEEKCKRCMICWKFCPEPAIFPTDPPTIDYDYARDAASASKSVRLTPSPAKKKASRRPA